MVGGVDPADASDPAVATAALARAGFIVSLEVRRSLVTEHADVVLPVAPAAEKAGRFVDWEGRRRPFDLVIKGTGAMSDGRVLNALAEELDVDLALPTIEVAREEMLRIGPAATRAAAPTAAAPAPARLAAGEARLGMWHELIDAGRMQDGDEHLAGTAKPAAARINAATAAALGVRPGGSVRIATAAGALSLPVLVDDLPDGVVWAPANARTYPVHAALGVAHGSVVRLTAGSLEPDTAVTAGEAGVRGVDR